MSFRDALKIPVLMAVVIVVSLAASIPGPAFAKNQGKGGGVEANKVAMLKVYDIMNSGNLQDLDKYVATDLKEHQMFPGVPTGLEGLKQTFTAMRTAFPDLHVNVEDTIATGDRVVCRITMTGTQKGTWMGMPPTGKSFSVQGIDIVRFQDGKGVEHWGSEDDLGMMQQLGMAPSNMGSAPPAK